MCFLFFDKSAASTTPPITCWIDDQAIFDCSLTVTEVPSGSSTDSTSTPRLYRKSTHLIAGSCFSANLIRLPSWTRDLRWKLHDWTADEHWLCPTCAQRQGASPDLCVRANIIVFAYMLVVVDVDHYKFLSANYHAEHFFLRSDDVQRTTQSLEVRLQFFFFCTSINCLGASAWLLSSHCIALRNASN